MPKPDRSSDLLLLAGKVITILMQAAMALGAAAVVIAFGAIAIFHGSIQAEMLADPDYRDVVFPTLSVLGILLIGFAMIAALFVFFGRLRAIINTVGEGDPFVPVNADRLSLMAWLMLGVQLLVLAAIPLALDLVELADDLGEDTHIEISSGFDLSGILMVILLFILARVFRHGAMMREDLEGTV
ncbi:DUF2975 domain-containing protein [Porphyrobacter sp. AAP82]|uniref:DUF2975 domain-containing protein n=1 Tax=Porphyrobacter sp. AAP82 TaxID=1248917 RepID=UPI0002E6F955|nr:DUF2975 domain-containing protein [Porphyrobacter sp. AAP82]